MAKRKNLIKVLATLGVSALIAGAGATTLSANATSSKTIAGGQDVSSFQMVYGASVRSGENVENGIRFSATISDAQYNALEKLEETSGVSVNYGVLIVPADLFNETNLTEENIFQMTPQEREQRGIGTLPAYLYEAINETRKSELVKQILGEHTFEKFIANKDIEWDNYRTHVSSYELEKYLSVL